MSDFDDWFGDSYGSDYTPVDLGSAADAANTSSLFSTGLDSILGNSDNGLGNLDLTSLLGSSNPYADFSYTLPSSDLGSFLPTSAVQSTDPITELLNKQFPTASVLSNTNPVTGDALESLRLSSPTESMLSATPDQLSSQLSNPVTQAMAVNGYLVNNPGVFGVDGSTDHVDPSSTSGYYHVDNPGVYGTNPDTSGTTSDESGKKGFWDWLKSPATAGVNTDAQAAQAALYKALGLQAPAGKTNLQMGLQAALAAAQIAGALTSKRNTNTTAPNLVYSTGSNGNLAATPMTWNSSRLKRAVGGPIIGSHHIMPTEMRKSGALGLLKGSSPGQQDDVPIQASHGEYVMDADTVAALGDGNTDAGAAKLDQMRQNIRAHKRSAPVDQIPPKAKSPLAYLKGTK